MNDAETLLGKYEKWKSVRDRTLASLSDQVCNEGYGSAAYGPYLSSAAGCHVTDINANTFLDTAMAGGTAILGHANPVINQAIIRQLEKGSIYTRPNAMAHELIDMVLQAVPGFSGAALCSTGSEATLRAIRIARACTGRQKIAIFSGGWHGSHDQVLNEEDYSGDEAAPRAMRKGEGIPRSVIDQLLFLPYNHAAAFDLIRRYADQLAMVFIEPAQGSNPRDDVGEFLKELRRVTEESGVLLGFDEIITGFRLALGGGQQYFGVNADIATYGKTLGGGLAIGMVAGTERVMSVIRQGPVFMGGTFSANPLAMAAAIATVRHLRENSRQIYPSLELKGETLKATVNDFCQKNNIGAHMIGACSMLRLILTGEPITSRRQRDMKEITSAKQADFYAAMLMNGIHIAGNRINFISTAHGERDMAELAQAYKDTLSAFSRAGVIYARDYKKPSSSPL